MRPSTSSFNGLGPDSARNGRRKGRRETTRKEGRVMVKKRVLAFGGYKRERDFMNEVKSEV